MPVLVNLALYDDQVSYPPRRLDLVFYHVVSGDGHPVEGEYKFTYGVGEVTAQGVEEPESTSLPIGIYIASAVFIISGLFFSIFAYRRRNK